VHTEFLGELLYLTVSASSPHSMQILPSTLLKLLPSWHQCLSKVTPSQCSCPGCSSGLWPLGPTLWVFLHPLGHFLVAQRSNTLPQKAVPPFHPQGHPPIPWVLNLLLAGALLVLACRALCSHGCLWVSRVVLHRAVLRSPPPVVLDIGLASSWNLSFSCPTCSLLIKPFGFALNASRCLMS
jgi:hypothetical protein